MKNMVYAALALAVFMSGHLCLSAETENPYLKAKVGDWVAYTTTTNMVAMNMKQTSTMKQTVKAKDEKEITLLIETEVMGNTMKQEVKIPLDQPYDPATANAQSGAKVEKVAEGEETVTVAGKEYACKWYQMKMTMNQQGADVSGVTKSWTCPDVPLAGMVKSESDMEVNMGGQAMKTQVVMEMKDCGHGQ